MQAVNYLHVRNNLKSIIDDAYYNKTVIILSMDEVFTKTLTKYED
ncbi:MAG: hypothetical protein U9N11_04540 [Campylobacterota bacterium]|nr:hypothetical protein [Campylobacterota bacterium]